MKLFRLRELAIQAVEYSLGSPRTYRLSLALAQAGLRGLGLNLTHDINRSGETFFLKRLVKQYPDRWFFDVGANRGDYVTALLDYGATKIAAFEPVPSTFFFRCRI
jgi:hypothetical protein